jgi:hypothetical protein
MISSWMLIIWPTVGEQPQTIQFAARGFDRVLRIVPFADSRFRPQLEEA